MGRLGAKLGGPANGYHNCTKDRPAQESSRCGSYSTLIQTDASGKKAADAARGNGNLWIGSSVRVCCRRGAGEILLSVAAEQADTSV